MSQYLQEMTIRLAEGIGRLPDEIRETHKSFLLNSQQDDGGFGGKQGSSDLYYTGFALRALSILGELYGDVAERAASFLRSRLSQHETIVDFFSLIYAAGLLKVAANIDVYDQAGDQWRDEVAKFFYSLQREDGGFAKAVEGRAGSTYHTFLIILCLQLIERPISNPDKIVKFVLSREDEEGGFREIKQSKRAGTNPTAAGVGTLRILDQVSDYVRDGVVDFLVDMQTEEGGMRANTRMPIADILSTFTGMLTLSDFGELSEIDCDAAEQFVLRQQMPTGGFRAAEWDEVADVEYTFYGLGSLALLANQKVQS